MRYITYLSYETQNLLNRFYKYSKKHDTRQRAKCILLSYKKFSINQLSEVFGVHINTIYNWFDNWEQNCLLSLYNSKGQGRKPLIDISNEQFMKEQIIKNPKQIKKIVVSLELEKGIKVSTFTVKRFIKKKLNYRWKRTRKSLKNRRPKDYEVKKQELEKLIELEKKDELKLFYADGSGISLTPCVPSAWQPNNERIEIPSFKSKVLNLFGIWDTKNDLNMYSKEGSLTSETIIEYIEDFSKTIKKRTVIVLDNASIHTSKLFKNKLLTWKNRNLEIFFLPTYSPHLNLIEHLWRFMKYVWIDFSAYNCWNNLVKYVENIVNNFGKLYTINFA